MCSSGSSVAPAVQMEVLRFGEFKSHTVTPRQQGAEVGFKPVQSDLGFNPVNQQNMCTPTSARIQLSELPARFPGPHPASTLTGSLYKGLAKDDLFLYSSQGQNAVAGDRVCDPTSLN